MGTDEQQTAESGEPSTSAAATEELLGFRDTEIEELEASLEEAEGEQEAHVPPISYKGTDFDVEGLVRRLERRDIVIPTFGEEVAESLDTARFQRNFVWRKTQMDRFIESLLLGFPIPGIILVQQLDKRFLVLDGQQRLRTLAAFYGGVYARKEFALQYVAPEFQGLTYRTLSAEQKRTLDSTFIQATIVQTDDTVASLDAVYQVFERLNSGGTQLTPHEIRMALYAGPLIEYLSELNHTPKWRELYGPVSPRLRDQELVLRILALFVSAETYRRPLKKFLNDFVAIHRSTENLDTDRLRELFMLACVLIHMGPGRGAFRRRGRVVNAAATEAMVVGVMRRLALGVETTPEDVSVGVSALSSDSDFVDAVDRSTADEESVRTRLTRSTNAFLNA